MQSTETWRPVLGYEGYYEVSDLARVRSVRRSRRAPSGYILKPGRHARGYHVYCLWRDGVRRFFLVHRLVAGAFISDVDGLVVRHMDDDPSNNVLSNLEVGSQKDNIHDAVSRGRLNPSNRGITECKRGHAFDVANTAYRKNGAQRLCRTCSRDWQRQYRAQKEGKQA